MKAALLHPGDGRHITVEERTRPFPGARRVLVAPRAVGICGSDLHYYRDGRIGNWVIENPHILGHEFAGVVEEAGRGVDSVRRGDRVTVEPIIPCEDCDSCRGGLYNLCADFRFIGSPHTDGALAGFVSVPESSVHHLPPGMSMEMGALVEPTSIAVHAVRRSELRGGEIAMVIGAGPIGLLIAAVAISYGAAGVFSLDINRNRLRAAERMGAWPVDVSRDISTEKLLAKTEPDGLDVVYEAVGGPVTLETALEVVRPGGKVVAVGVCAEERIPFNLMLAQSKEATVIPVFLGRDAFPEAIELLSSGEVDGEALLGEPFPLEQAGLAMQMAAAGADGPIKMMIRPSREDGES